MAEPTRLGIVGTENSHADHYVAMANTQGRFPGLRVVALAGGDSERNRTLAAGGGVEQVVDDPSDLIGKVDAAIVCSRNGHQHRSEAVPLLRAGIPVLVDKPLACSVDDAQAILEAAAAAGVPVTSSSALRYLPAVTRLATQLADSRPEVLQVSGPADASSEHGGLFFYGIHSVEILFALLRSATVRDVTASSFGDLVVITAVSGSTPVVLHLDQPRSGHQSPWRVVARLEGRAVARQIDLDDHYLAPQVAVFAEMLRTGKRPLTDAQLVAPVRLLETAVAQAG
jgi:predicted dehydrogenase